MTAAHTPSNDTFRKVMRWTIGIMFILGGFGILETDLVYGAAILIAGAILLPPVKELINKKMKGHFTWGKQIIVIVGISVFGVVLSNEIGAISLDPNSSTTQTTEVELIADDAVPIGERYVYDVTGLVEEKWDNIDIYAEPSRNTSVGEVQFGQKVILYETDETADVSLISYEYSHEEVGEMQTTTIEGWVSNIFLVTPEEYEKQINPGINITNHWVTQNSIGVPEVNLTFSNNTGKDIDGVKITVVGVNNFGEAVTNSISGSLYFSGYAQQTITNGQSKTLHWTLNLYESVTATSVEITELHFTDGSGWNGSIKNSMSEFDEKLLWQ